MLDVTYQIPQHTNDYHTILTINKLQIVKDVNEITTIGDLRYTNFKLYEYARNVLHLTQEEMDTLADRILNANPFSFRGDNDQLIVCLGTTYTLLFTFDKSKLSECQLKMEFGSRINLDQAAIDSEFESILRYLQIGYSYDLVEITEYLTGRNYKEYKTKRNTA